MDTNKDIFDQIKDKSQGLKLDVNSKLWDRLENKLEAAASQKKKRSYGFLRIAASVVLIVGLTSIATLFLFQNKNVLMANNTFQIEELKDNSSASAKFQRQESDRMMYRKKLEELYGDSAKKSSFK